MADSSIDIDKLKTSATLSAEQFRAEAIERASRAQQALAPAQQHFQATFSKHPLVATYAVFFAFLGALPIGIFLIYALGAAVVIGSIALFILLCVVGAAFALLFATLVVVGFVAGVATFWAVALFLTVRLVANLQSSGSIGDGLQAFTAELRALIARPSRAQLEEKREAPVDNESKSTTSSNVSTPVLSDVKHEGE